MFICIAALTCAVLIPINVVYNLRYVKEDNRNYLLILTMSKVKGNWLWCVRIRFATVCFANSSIPQGARRRHLRLDLHGLLLHLDEL